MATKKRKGKKRVGRPPLPVSRRRDRMVRFNVTQAEWKQLEAAGQEKDLSPSEQAHEWILERLAKEEED